MRDPPHLPVSPFSVDERFSKATQGNSLTPASTPPTILLDPFLTPHLHVGPARAEPAKRRRRGSISRGIQRTSEGLSNEKWYILDCTGEEMFHQY